MNKIKDHTRLDMTEALNGMGFPKTVSLGLNYSTWPRQLQTLSSDRSSGDTHFRSDRPPYIHMGRDRSTNGATRRRKRVWNTHTPSRPSLTSFHSSSSMASTLCFSKRAQPHDQLFCFTGLPSVNAGNGASTGFWM